MFEFVQSDCQRLASSHRKHDAYVAGLKRKRDLHHVFRAVRRDPPSQVDILIEPVSATVVDVLPEELSVTLDKSVQLDQSGPVLISGSPVPVIAQYADQVWLERLENEQPGDPVVFQSQVGSLDHIFQAFTGRWSARGARHEGLPLDHWSTILDFARDVLPPVQAPELSLTVDMVRSCAAKKKVRAAAGPDGVSREDVLHLTDAEISSLISLFHRAMTDGCWPAQLYEGVVRSLAKRPTSQGVADYRPVTIYSFVYRLWSSLFARRWMSCWEPFGSSCQPHVASADGCYGGCPYLLSSCRRCCL